MDIHELRTKRQELETELAKRINLALLQFKAATGFSVECVSVYLVNVTKMGSGEREYIVSRVDCDVSI